MKRDKVIWKQKQPKNEKNKVNKIIWKQKQPADENKERGNNIKKKVKEDQVGCLVR